VGIGEAFLGGFSSFFSIWQVCAMQISPFFMAFITGLYFVGQSRQGDAEFTKWAVTPAVVYVAGFSMLYALLSSPGLLVGRYLSYNLGTLRLIAGLYLSLVSLFLIVPDRIGLFRKMTATPVLAGLSLLLSLSFVVVYSPCITPTLSKVLSIASVPSEAARGAVLAFFYGLGLSLAFAVTGLTLIQLLTRVRAVANHPARTSMVCGLVLGILAFMNVTGLMTYYKAFVLGFLVP
jgi:cytochrome c-type biogenesis protein